MTNVDREASSLGQALRYAAAHRMPLRAVGAASAMAAHVGLEAGFDALWVSGLEVSTALGLPDENVLGPQDLAAVALAVRRVADLPVIVDVDNGGGTIALAHRIAADLAQAGAAGLCLEDSAYPKINSFATHRRQGLADVDLVCAQVAAMRDAVGADVVIIGRTETLICGGTVAEAVARAATFVEAGADAVLMHSKDCTGDEALAIGEAWTAATPLVIVPTAFPHMTVADLGAAGFALAIYANQLSRSALAAMQATAAAFTTTGSFSGPGAPPLAAVQELLQIADQNARATV